MKWLVFFLCCLIAGCCESPVTDNCQPPPLDCSLAGSTVELEKQDVQIIRTGETITLVIPTDPLFYGNSESFRDESIFILEPLICYLENVLSEGNATLMTVNAYTDDETPDAELLTQLRAEQMVAELTARGIDRYVRVIYARGYGAYHPVGDNSIPSHQAWNRRIEIKFRRVVLPPLV